MRDRSEEKKWELEKRGAKPEEIASILREQRKNWRANEDIEIG